MTIGIDLNYNGLINLQFRVRYELPTQRYMFDTLIHYKDTGNRVDISYKG